MLSDHFFKKVNTYARLSEASRKVWQKLLRKESCKKGEYFIELGQIPTRVAMHELQLLRGGSNFLWT